MKNQHRTYFKIENFKKFDSLEINDLSRFNLIVGDNNVGKTCLLEGLCIDFNSKQLISDLEFILSKRDIEVGNILIDKNKIEFNFLNNVVGLSQRIANKSFNLYRKIFNSDFIEEISVENLLDFNPSKQSDTNKFIEDVNLFQYKEIDQLSKNWLIFKQNIINNKKYKKSKINFLCDVTSRYYKDFTNQSDYLPFIKLSDLYSTDLISFYKKIVRSPKDEEKLLNILNKIFKNLNINRITINEFVDGQEFIQLSTNDRMEYHPVSQYGDGFIKALRIVLEILFTDKNFICIDEIDSGIHFTKLHEFLHHIMLVCNELDMQVFMATHSKECIETFLNVSKNLNFSNDIRLIELKEYENKVYAQTLNSNEANSAIESDINIRGGNLYDNV